MLSKWNATLLVLLSTSILSPVFAACNGSSNSGFGYIGLMLGPGRANGSTDQIFYKIHRNPFFPLLGVPPFSTGVVELDSKPFVARIYAGYDFPYFLGFELGVSFISNITFKRISGAQLPDEPEAKIRAVDLVAKGTLPLGPFHVFAKAGVALAYEKTSNFFNIPDTILVRTPFPHYILRYHRENWQHEFRPTYSVGIGYDFTQNWTGDITFTRVSTRGIVNNFDYVAVGIAYQFRETYCGQFLCDS